VWAGVLLPERGTYIATRLPHTNPQKVALNHGIRLADLDDAVNSQAIATALAKKRGR
jgi:hypothetical protein